MQERRRDRRVRTRAPNEVACLLLRLANGLTLAGAFRESTLMSGIIRVLVPLDSQSDAAFQLAFKYAESICQKSGANVIVLLTHTKSQLEHTGLARMLGSHVIKAIGKGNATTSAGYALRAETMRTLRYLSQKSVLVVYYAEAGILDVADGVQNVAGVVAVPDHPGDADPWVQRWGAHVHGQTRQAPSVLIKDPVVVAALDELTKIINLSTGLAHPRDNRLVGRRAEQVLNPRVTRHVRALDDVDRDDARGPCALAHRVEQVR